MSNPIRVLNSVFDERVGGPQLRIIQVGTRLRADGIETIVAKPKGGEALCKALAREGVEYEEVRLNRLRQSFDPRIHFRYLKDYRPGVRQIRSLIRRRGIDIVHTNGLLHSQAALAAHLEKTPLVWHLNDFITPWPLRPAFLTLVRRWASRIAVASKAVGRAHFPPGDAALDKICVLYAPVDTERFQPGLGAGKVRSQLGIPEEAPLIGAVGNLNPLKGHETLIRAAARVRRRIPDLRTVIVGEKLANRAAYGEALQRLGKELGLGSNLIFAGRRDDVPEVLAALDVYVHSSTTEACPMAVLEASASAKPVVATSVGGTPELVRDGISGLLVPSKNPEEMAEAILQLLARPETGKKMGEKGREHVLRHFSLQCCVRRHRAIYEPLAGRPGSGDAEEELYSAALGAAS